MAERKSEGATIKKDVTGRCTCGAGVHKGDKVRWDIYQRAITGCPKCENYDTDKFMRADSIGDQSIPVSAKIDAALARADAVKEIKKKVSGGRTIRLTKQTISGDYLVESFPTSEGVSSDKAKRQHFKKEDEAEAYFSRADSVSGPEEFRKKQMTARYQRMIDLIQSGDGVEKLRALMPRLREAKSSADLDKIEEAYRAINVDSRTKLDACLAVADSITK